MLFWNKRCLVRGFLSFTFLFHVNALWHTPDVYGQNRLKNEPVFLGSGSLLKAHPEEFPMLAVRIDFDNRKCVKKACPFCQCEKWEDVTPPPKTPVQPCKPWMPQGAPINPRTGLPIKIKNYNPRPPPGACLKRVGPSPKIPDRRKRPSFPPRRPSPPSVTPPPVTPPRTPGQPATYAPRFNRSPTPPRAPSRSRTPSHGYQGAETPSLPSLPPEASQPQPTQQPTPPVEMPVVDFTNAEAASTAKEEKIKMEHQVSMREAKEEARRNQEELKRKMKEYDARAEKQASKWAGPKKKYNFPTVKKKKKIRLKGLPDRLRRVKREIAQINLSIRKLRKTLGNPANPPIRQRKIRGKIRDLKVDLLSKEDTLETLQARQSKFQKGQGKSKGMSSKEERLKKLEQELKELKRELE